MPGSYFAPVFISFYISMHYENNLEILQAKLLIVVGKPMSDRCGIFSAVTESAFNDLGRYVLVELRKYSIFNRVFSNCIFT